MMIDGRSLLPVCVGGIVCWVAAVALEAVRATLMFGACTVGMPVVVPCTWMLAALMICNAARLTLPETRMPASPASMVPSGATRLMLPGGTCGIGFKVAMPAPVEGTVGANATLP